MATFTESTTVEETVLSSTSRSTFSRKSATYTASTFTGKSFSEALILESVNPKYDKRLFIEFPEEYKYSTSSVKILF